MDAQLFSLVACEIVLHSKIEYNAQAHELVRPERSFTVKDIPQSLFVDARTASQLCHADSALATNAFYPLDYERCVIQPCSFSASSTLNCWMPLSVTAVDSRSVTGFCLVPSNDHLAYCMNLQQKDSSAFSNSVNIVILRE